MVDKSLTHNMYLSRQNATTYEYMYDGQDDGDVEQRLNELGGEGWILINAEFTSQGSKRIKMFLQRPKAR